MHLDNETLGNWMTLVPQATMAPELVRSLNGNRYKSTNKELNGHFDTSTSDDRLFNKSQKRTSRMLGNSLSCNSDSKSEVVEKLFQNMNVPPAICDNKSNSESTIPPFRRKTSKINPLTSVGKGALYKKSQAETLSIKKNRYRAMKQHAHRNKPSESAIEQGGVVKKTSSVKLASNCPLPSYEFSGKQSQTNHALPKPKSKLSNYKIPKRKDITQKCDESKSNTCNMNVRNSYASNTTENNRKEFSKKVQKQGKEFHKKNETKKFGECTDKMGNKVSATVKDSLSSKSMSKENESISSTRSSLPMAQLPSESQKTVAKRHSTKVDSIPSTLSLSSSSSSSPVPSELQKKVGKRRSKRIESISTGSPSPLSQKLSELKKTVAKRRSKRVEPIPSTSTPSLSRLSSELQKTVEKRHSTEIESIPSTSLLLQTQFPSELQKTVTERHLTEIESIPSTSLLLPTQFPSELQKTVAESHLTEIESNPSTCSSSSVSQSSSTLRKAVQKRRSFKRVSVADDDDEDDDDDDFDIRPSHSKKCRPIQSDSEESGDEELDPELQQGIDSTSSNESILSNSTIPISSTVTDTGASEIPENVLKNTDINVMLNGEDNSNRVEDMDDDFENENAVMFEDYYSYNFNNEGFNNEGLGIRVENVESITEEKNEENLPAFGFSQMPLIGISNQPNFENSPSNECAIGNKREILIITLDDDDTVDDEIVAIEENPVNPTLPISNYTPYDCRPVGSVQELFKKSKVDTMAGLLQNYVQSNSSNKDVIREEILKECTAQSVPTCFFCKETKNMMKTCSRCGQTVCRYVCDIDHPCSPR